ncbi:MAG: hypothetical protein E7377_01585 [Clostridiales bacterium]|nr:hypothetical protein [Clostridiales bacterium]
MDDFFEELNEDKKTEEKGLNSTMPPTKHEKKRKTRTVVTAIGLAVVSFIAGGFSVWFSLDKQLRTLAKVKNTIDREYYKEIDDEVFYGAIFDAVNGQLDDYSGYMTADEYAASADSLAGKRAGIGLVFSTLDENGKEQMKIVRVCGNSPAEEAGVVAGSHLIAFGKTKDGLVESQVFSEFSDFLNTCKDEESFWVRLRVGETESEKQLKKSMYVENYVFYKTNAKSYGFCGNNAEQLTENGAPMSYLNDETAYIRLTQFGGEAGSSFQKVMNLFKTDGKKNLVLDLRGNGGGYLDVMQEIASYFCKGATEKKPIAAVADFGEKKQKYKATDNLYGEYFSNESRICVLADSSTASASEALIGCMIDYGAVGYGDICLSQRNGVAKTFGKGIMQATYFLGAEKDAIKLTTAEICWPISERSIHTRGILPQDGTKTVAEGVNDEIELEMAIKALF